MSDINVTANLSVINVISMVDWINLFHNNHLESGVDI